MIGLETKSQDGTLSGALEKQEGFNAEDEALRKRIDVLRREVRGMVAMGDPVAADIAIIDSKKAEIRAIREQLHEQPKEDELD